MFNKNKKTPTPNQHVESDTLVLDNQKKLRRNKVSKNLFIACSVIPAIALFIWLVIYPVVNMFYLSFTKLQSTLDEPRFIGFSNYSALFKDKTFWLSMKNTVILIVVVTVVTFVLALYFANLLAKKRMAGKTFYRILFYIPNILSIIVIAEVFNIIYKTDNGLLSAIIGGNYKSLLDSEKTIIWGIAIAMIWQAFGYYMVMYIAAMDGIPDSLYESASLDGASKFKQFMVITLPLTWEVIRVTLTFFIVGAINMSFLFVDSMGSGGRLNNSHVLLTYMQQQANGGSYGYAMSIGVILFVLSYAVSLILNWLTRRETVEY